VADGTESVTLDKYYITIQYIAAGVFDIRVRACRTVSLSVALYLSLFASLSPCLSVASNCMIILLTVAHLGPLPPSPACRASDHVSSSMQCALNE